MTLPELLQWAELNGKDGTLVIKGAGVQKFYFFQQGKLIYFSSQQKAEKLDEHLISTGLISREKLTEALYNSKKLNIPFLGYLISEKTFSKEDLQDILVGLVNSATTEALQWQSGTFEFKEEVPPLILNGPIKLNVTQILFHSSVASDETDSSGQRYAEQILQDLDRRIQSGRINLPATPDLIAKLNSAANDDRVSLAEISKIITSDQVLASKILKVANSPFFNIGSEIVSLQRAISLMGLSALKSIATAHALFALSPGKEKKIKPVLHHSLLTAFVAKQLAKEVEIIDQDEAFVCGILHDIGKTVLIDYLAAGELPDHVYAEIIDKHHSRAGFLLTREWQLSEIVQETVLHHHTPDKATKCPLNVLITYYADRIANGTLSEEDLQFIEKDLQVDAKTIQQLTQNIDDIKDQVTDLL